MTNGIVWFEFNDKSFHINNNSGWKQMTVAILKEMYITLSKALD